ncbi:hypothetical protein FisN_21Lh231 [Fistulifera solaris]|uniref:Interferon-related developmental regulator N-terminal domain-containing protein n=1 Tax=Fistulifera solaris TaxID=1519565 RepID=A0A1Z5J949_FISSO|nr:hypothetical protein FisN_21Lh231 [Fistulifera solaris]|eukprot:GAX10524.1 hypothetical protein FisN_21Lh231 [Fistulifera solaris]
MEEMAKKKPHSQQRKRGQFGDTDDPAEAFDALSEEHTIADSLGTYESAFEGDDLDGTIEDSDFWQVGTENDDQNNTAAARQSRLQDALEGLNEYASEKRATRREAKLRRAFKALTQFADTRNFHEVIDTDLIRQAAFHAIRTGPPSEQYAACRVLEATSVVLGHDEEEWCQSLDRQLRSVIQTIQRATAVRMAALRAMCMSVLVNTAILHQDSATTEAWMDLCEEIAKPEWRNESVPPALRATALDCWGLLATGLSEFDLSGQDEGQMGRGLAILTLLQESLDEMHGDLRAAAGECLALIHEARWQTGGDDGANVTARQFHKGSWEGSEWEPIIDLAQQRISELSTESGYNLSKKAKKAQRATFREFMATLVDNESPEEVVQFRNGTTLELTSWKEIIQLSFVRHCLQGGFQNQLLTNPTLQFMFGLDGSSVNDKGNSFSQLEKRLLLSKTSEASKLQDQKRSKDRRKKENYKNDFLLNE